MRTSFDIPEALIRAAQSAVGVKTKTQTIVLALTELVQHRESRKILELRGSLRGAFDHKALRKKR